MFVTSVQSLTFLFEDVNEGVGDYKLPEPQRQVFTAQLIFLEKRAKKSAIALVC